MKNYFSLASLHTFYVIGDKGNAFWGDRKINCNKKHSEDSHITTDDYPKMPLLRRVEQGQCDGCAWLETKLQRQRDGEQWAVDMLLMDDVDELLHDSGMLDDNTLVIFTSDNGPTRREVPIPRSSIEMESCADSNDNATRAAFEFRSLPVGKATLQPDKLARCPLLSTTSCPRLASWLA